MRFSALLARILSAIFLLSAMAAAPAGAQDQVWLQIEAKPGLEEATGRAAAYAAVFPQVRVYEVRGWYAIVLGPMGRAEAAAELAELRAENLIPQDSFIADGRGFGAVFFPAPGRAAQIEAAPEVAPEASTSDAPESLAQAQEAEDALASEDKMALQRALAWFGFYDGAIDGAFGRGTRASFAAWQAAAGHEPTGVLLGTERAALLAAEADERRLYGFETVIEDAAGIEVTLPLALVEFAGYEPPFVQFAPRASGGPRLMLISEPGDRASLAGLFDLLQSTDAVPAGEGSGTSALEDTSFDINAASGTVATRAWAQTAKGQVKGFVLTWTPDRAREMDRIAEVIRASFRSFGEQVLDPGLLPLDEAARQGLLTGLTPRRPAFSRSGFYVSAGGDVLTAAQGLGACGSVSIDGGVAMRLAAADPVSGAALLTPGRTLAPAAVAGFAATSTPRGAEVVVAGYSYGDKLPAPVLTFGHLEETSGLNGEPGLSRLRAPVLEGDIGGPVLAASGAVIGLLGAPDAGSGKTLPAGVALAASAAALTAFLQANGVEPLPHDGTTLSPSALSDLALGMTLRVDCWE